RKYNKKSKQDISEIVGKPFSKIIQTYMTSFSPGTSNPLKYQHIWRDSNPRHVAPETTALSPELQMHTCVFTSCLIIIPHPQGIVKKKLTFLFLNFPPPGHNNKSGRRVSPPQLRRAG